MLLVQTVGVKKFNLSPTRGQLTVVLLADSSADMCVCVCSGGGRLSVRGQGSLYISNVTEADAGSYICRATNLEDSVDAEATLIVHGRD